MLNARSQQSTEAQKPSPASCMPPARSGARPCPQDQRRCRVSVRPPRSPIGRRAFLAARQVGCSCLTVRRRRGLPQELEREPRARGPHRRPARRLQRRRMAFTHADVLAGFVRPVLTPSEEVEGWILGVAGSPPRPRSHTEFGGPPHRPLGRPTGEPRNGSCKPINCITN